MVFADAGYWIAVWHPQDSLHDAALAAGESLGSTEIVTTQLVLVEALNAMAGLGEFRRLFAAQMIERLERTPGVKVVPMSDRQFRAAVDRYAARPDQEWSLTDCASFLVMEEYGITEALAHDRDFERAGFVALLR
ncbi:MAG: type II toxin-antitoxin system VapC family toxin [Acidimicrobiia bacterium]|nr:type II toxin-antitoxin system VapC family toxin [Acidimicrobiia bacterium]MYE67066.1 type II toxin-antitoxin system VapC family toxin [Acidimicrobiia bacterium]MYJ13745.1 type II toxin-antitoxin system VapC family toxin [Acidimicrobiia bacterium]